jgi:hypothetical protein
MIQVESDRIIGGGWWQIRRCIAWTIDDDGERRYGPRRLTRAGAERALCRGGSR